jgi:probable rRNA maturation factor
VIEVEVENRSGAEVDEAGAVAVAQRVLAAEGIESGELGLLFVAPDESRDLKRSHLGVDEATDALAFPIDGLDALPDGVPRQLGDVVVCPQVTGDAWHDPLVHALLHLVGYDHGPEMEAREALHRRRLDGGEHAEMPALPALEREP